MIFIKDITKCYIKLCNHFLLLSSIYRVKLKLVVFHRTIPIKGPLSKIKNYLVINQKLASLSLIRFGCKCFKKVHLWKQDKGQTACSFALINSVKNGTETPIPVNELFEVAQVTIDIAEQLRIQK